MPDSGPSPTPELIGRVVGASDEEERGDAWRRLIEPCRPLLGCVLRRFPVGAAGASYWEVDDLCQELFLHLSRDDWRRLRCYQARPGATFATWLAAVAYDLLLQKLRRKPVPMVSVDHAAEGGRALVDSLATAGHGLAEEVHRRAVAQALQEALARLRHGECREIIRRHCYFGERLVDLGAELGLRADAVRQMYHRNKEELRRLIPSSLVEEE